MNIKTFYQNEGEYRLVAHLLKLKFTSYYLHLMPEDSNSEKFIKIECIQDVLDASNCDISFVFDHCEDDCICNKSYFYFKVKNSDDVIHTLVIDAETDISMMSKDLESIVQILVGHYNYKNSDTFYSKAVNNIEDEILTAEETVKNEKIFLTEMVADYTIKETEECKNALISFIQMREKQDLNLFETKEQMKMFINDCIKQLEV